MGLILQINHSKHWMDRVFGLFVTAMKRRVSIGVDSMLNIVEEITTCAATAAKATGFKLNPAALVNFRKFAAAMYNLADDGSFPDELHLADIDPHIIVASIPNLTLPRREHSISKDRSMSLYKAVAPFTSGTAGVLAMFHSPDSNSMTTYPMYRGDPEALELLPLYNGAALSNADGAHGERRTDVARAAAAETGVKPLTFNARCERDVGYNYARKIEAGDKATRPDILDLQRRGVRLWGGGNLEPIFGDGTAEYTPRRCSAPGFIVVRPSALPFPTYEYSLAHMGGDVSRLMIENGPEEVFSKVPTRGCSFVLQIAAFNSEKGGSNATTTTTLGTLLEFLLDKNELTRTPRQIARFATMPKRSDVAMQSRLLLSRSCEQNHKRPGPRQNAFQLFGGSKTAWEDFKKEHDGGMGDFARDAAQRGQMRTFELGAWQKKIDGLPQDDWRTYMGGLRKKWIFDYLGWEYDGCDDRVLVKVGRRSSKGVITRLRNTNGPAYDDNCRNIHPAALPLLHRDYNAAAPSVALILAVNAVEEEAADEEEEEAADGEEEEAADEEEEEPPVVGRPRLVTEAFVMVDVRLGEGPTKSASVVVVKHDDTVDPTIVTNGDDYGESFVIAGYYVTSEGTVGLPFVQRLGDVVGEFSWLVGKPVGFLQTQMRATYDDNVVARVADIINGVVHVERLATFDPDNEGECVALDLLSTWDRPTRFWLAAYLSSLGVFIHPTKMSALRSKDAVQVALRHAAAAKAAHNPPAQAAAEADPPSAQLKTRHGRTIVRPQRPGD
jgi:hypothetical protein